jgi:hypothetical protein
MVVLQLPSADCLFSWSRFNFSTLCKLGLHPVHCECYILEIPMVFLFYHTVKTASSVIPTVNDNSSLYSSSVLHQGLWILHCVCMIQGQPVLGRICIQNFFFFFCLSRFQLSLAALDSVLLFLRTESLGFVFS